jgi:hypothetical protein
VDAYRIQDHWAELKMAPGVGVAGHKIGLTCRLTERRGSRRPASGSRQYEYAGAARKRGRLAGGLDFHTERDAGPPHRLDERVAGTLVAAAAFALILDFVKVPVSDVSGSARSRPVRERNNDRRRCSL